MSLTSEGNPLEIYFPRLLSHTRIRTHTSKVRFRQTKTKTPKKSKVDCWIGDLAKTKTKF